MSGRAQQPPSAHAERTPGPNESQGNAPSGAGNTERRPSSGRYYEEPEARAWSVPPQAAPKQLPCQCAREDSGDGRRLGSLA